MSCMCTKIKTGLTILIQTEFRYNIAELFTLLFILCGLIIMENHPLSGQTMLDLRGRQSVRATFKLSQRAIDALGLVALHMGIKQKSLFDHIIEDTKALENLARTIHIQKFQQIPRKQKTFVLSRKTIDALAAISQAHDMPRDALVEYSIQKLEQIITTEKIRHQERKKLYAKITDQFQEQEELYLASANILGPDDPLCRQLEKSVLHNRKIQEELTAFLEKSRVLENY